MTEPKPPAEPTPVPPPEPEAPAASAPATPDEAPATSPTATPDEAPAPPEADEVTEPVALDADAVAELMPAEEVADAAPPPAPAPAPAATPLPPASPPPAAPPVAPPAAVPVVTTTPPAPAPVAAPVAAAPVVAEPPKKRTALGTISRIVAFLFGILQALLILRIVLLLLIANPDNEIVSWVLSVTDPFVEPFRGIFNLDEITGQRGAVLDVAAIVALIAWSLIETLILSVMRLIGRRS